jgi:hypothetical protein
LLTEYWGSASTGIGLSCSSAGPCLVVAWPGPEGVLHPGRSCWLLADASPPTQNCWDLNPAAFLPAGSTPGWFGGVLSLAGRAAAFFRANAGGCSSDAWAGMCWSVDGPSSTSILPACDSGSPPPYPTDLLHQESLAPADDTVRAFSVMPDNPQIAWAQFGSCGDEALFGGTIHTDWTFAGSMSLDYSRGPSPGDLVALASWLAPPTGVWDADPAETLSLVFLDSGANVTGAPTTITSMPPGIAGAEGGSPQVALLDDGSAIVAVPGLLPHDEDYWGYRGLAHIPAGGSTEPVPLRTERFKTQVYVPVALPGARFALFWKEYWAVGSSEWPVCDASCRPLTVLLGLDPSSLETPASETLCLSMGDCVVEAQAEYVGGRLVILWREETDSTSPSYHTSVNLAVLDLTDYEMK